MSEAMLAKIRKLLAKAEDPAATEHEAEVYTTKAAELVATYGIDRALLAQADPDSDLVGDRVVVVESPYAQDKSELLSGVAARLRCRAVQRTSYLGGRKELSLHLFGFESDLLRAEVLYTSLLLQATSGVTRARPLPGEQLAAFRRSWLRGFTYAVVTRLSETEDRAQGEAEAARPPDSTARSVALVLADRSVAVNDALREHYPDVRHARARTLSGSGGHQGWSAGQRADLGGQQVPQGRVATSSLTPRRRPV